MTMTSIFIEPLDVLYLRGNRSFGAPGDHAAAQMPPWPSLVAGALRSRLLADSGQPLDSVRAGNLAEPLSAVLGSATNPGTFRLSQLVLARRENDALMPFRPAPADLFCDQHGTATYLSPTAVGLPSSAPLPQVAALPLPQAGKPHPYWLNHAAWAAYLLGRPLAPCTLCKASDLWDTDPRVGVGLDPHARAAAEGKLVSSDTVAFKREVGREVGLLAAVSGDQALTPTSGLVRLGGDGRAAQLSPAPAPPPRDYAALAAMPCLRLIFTSPALFTGGSCLPAPLDQHVVAASIPRHQIISGWDLANWRPKPALRAVPAGAVYWLESPGASAEQLEAWEMGGLWDQPLDQFRTRKPEGFNAVVFAPWAQSSKENHVH